MNREQKLTRLQTLLERVQMRATQQREPRGSAAAAFAAEPETIPRRPAVPMAPLGFEIAPVQPLSMPTPEPFDADETRPFSKRPSVKPPPAPAIPSADPGLGAKAVLEEETPPASSRRAVKAREQGPALDISTSDEEMDLVTVRTKAPQLAPRDEGVRLEVDTERGGLGTAAAGPTPEQLGQTVELEEAPQGAAAALELDERPVAKKPEPVVVEMEAEIPAAGAPGAYTRELEKPAAAPEEAVFPQEVSTSGWAIPESVKEPAVAEAKPVIAQPAVAEAKPVIAQPAVAEAKPLVVEPVAPVEIKPAIAQAPAAAPPPAEAKPIVEQPAPVEVAAAVQEQPPAKPEPMVERPVTLELLSDAGPALVIKPVVIQVEPSVVRAPVIEASDIAAFQGAVEAFQPTTFLALLDASLDLGVS